LRERDDLLPNISMAGEVGLVMLAGPETVEIQHTCGANQQIMRRPKAPAAKPSVS
jgi:hypothetical protein